MISSAQPIPYAGPGVVDLGAANAGALRRLANYATAIVKSGTIPPSPFSEWAADRVCGEDKQDIVVFIQGRRGSGKSYSCLYLGQRVAEAIARRKGGRWQDFFNLLNCATLEDTDKVLEILNSAKENQIVLIDDAALAMSNRAWNSQQNRNFNALLTVCRTRRWVLLMTAPLKSHVDNQIRQMCDLVGTIYKPFHSGGFNVLKITSSEIGISNNKEYNKRLNFSKKRVDFWIAFRPDKEMARAYDIQRDQGSKRVSQSIVDTGSFHSPKKEKLTGKSRAELNLEKLIEVHGEEIKKMVVENPDITSYQIGIRCGLHNDHAARIVARLGIALKPKKSL